VPAAGSSFATFKQWLIPGSIEFLLLGITCASILLLTPHQRIRGWGRWLVMALAAGYLMMSVPVVADGLVAISAGGMSQVQPADVREIGVLVVLDAGGRHYDSGGRVADVPVPSSVFRALEALRVYQLLSPGAWAIVTTGGYGEGPEQQFEGAAVQDQLLRGGIPAGRLVMDTTSRNTIEHARFLRSWLAEHHLSRFVLVTSATHARRARLTFRTAGLDPIVSPASMRSDGYRGRVWPDAASLEISRQTIYDLLGLAYYRARGWA
jgi:uncharacterized SAM-binding protein YcdF (DUF218 family)